MKAVIWPYKYKDMNVTWAKPMCWLVNALQVNGVEVKKHPDLLCTGLENLPIYDWRVDKDNDICIYNHADMSHLLSANILPVKKNWFFKSTVPDEFHITLDELGYGPYSSVTYNKPNFENYSDEEVEQFFSTKVQKWIEDRNTKWGKFHQLELEEINFKDYFLVLGQCLGDEVVTRHDFGNYYSKLHSIVKELHRVSQKLIIIKLHPFVMGIDTDKKLESVLKLQKSLEEIGPRVKVFYGKSNVHNFIKNAYCVLLANSGAGYEAMMHHKPIIAWGCPEYRWITYDLRHIADLFNAIKLDWFDVKKQDKFLYWYLEKYCYYNQETANRRVKELLS